MSASDHLNPQQFYHGTKDRFSIGQELTASGARQANPNYPANIQHVWAAASPIAASTHAIKHGKEHWDSGRVYQVEPMHPHDVELDPLGHGGAYRSPTGFRVTRDMGSPAELWK